MVTVEILRSHPVGNLKKEISKTNIKNYSKLKKSELIELMMKHRHRFHHMKMRNAKTEPQYATPVDFLKGNKTRTSTPTLSEGAQMMFDDYTELRQGLNLNDLESDAERNELFGYTELKHGLNLNHLITEREQSGYVD